MTQNNLEKTKAKHIQGTVGKVVEVVSPGDDHASFFKANWFPRVATGCDMTHSHFLCLKS